MRDFFINSFEKLVAVLIVLLGIGVVIGAFGAAQDGGVLAFIGVLIAGSIYVVMVGGLMYLGLGIYHNTKRMADAMDRSGPPNP